MATRTFGQLPEFHPVSKSISAYVEHADLFFTVNDIPNENKVSVLLTVIGANAYTWLRSLLSPELPLTKTYEHLVETLKRYYEPKPLIITEQFHFHCRTKTAREYNGEYIAELGDSQHTVNSVLMWIKPFATD